MDVLRKRVLPFIIVAHIFSDDSYRFAYSLGRKTMFSKSKPVAFAVCLSLMASILTACAEPTPSPTPTDVPTATSTSTSTPTVTPSPTITNTPAPTNTATITPTPSPYDGSWKGTTSEGLPVTFTVSKEVISNFTLNCQLGLGVTGVTATVEVSPPDLNGPIVNGSINFSNVAMTLTGTFYSTTSAGGTLTSKPDLSLCKLLSISWNANKK
jgi:hypothetical protein